MERRPGSDESRIETPLRRNPRILMVDDERFDLDLMEMISIRLHVTFMMCDSAFDALKELHKAHYKYDAAVIDYSMPEMSGRELSRKIREDEPMFGRQRPMEIYWFTGWDFQHFPDYHPMVQGFKEYMVRKCFIKGSDTYWDIVAEIKRDLGPLEVSGAYPPAILPKDIAVE